jgi:DNA-binding PadR family transcriptional regulator
MTANYENMISLLLQLGQRACTFGLGNAFASIEPFSCGGASDAPQLAARVRRRRFTMSSILEKQMCGYDLIKDIFTRCDVFLSQGTVYPVLYTLEGDGLLHAEYSKGDMRSKKYSLTPSGRKVAEKEVEDFAKALEQVSMLLKR